MFHRSRRNLAVWFTLSMGSILVIFAGILYLREANDRLQAFDQTLHNISRLMAAGVENYIYQGQQRIDLENVPVLGSDTLPLSTDLTFARWYTADHRLLQFVGEVPPMRLKAAMGFQTLVIETEQTKHRLRQLTLPVYHHDRLIGHLQIAASLSVVEQPLQQLRWFLAGIVPLTLGTIALAGSILGGKAMQPIRQSYQQLQQFTADASHELRAPLAGILSHAQVGLLEPIEPQEQHYRLTVIVQVAESLGGLVNQLLLLARHQGPLPPHQLSSIDLMPFLQSLLEPSQLQAEQKQHTIRSDFPTVPVWVAAEPDLLRQAIANLLNNAHRYTPAQGTIDLKLFQTHRWAVIQVKDTGIGIAAKDLPHIFDRFYRADPARSRETGGFGLGLAIARQIIEVHRGQLTVQSVLHQGSTFEIRLPLQKP